MKKRFLLAALPLLAACGIWLVNSVLTTILFDNPHLRYRVPGAVCAFMILVAGYALSIWYSRLLGAHRRAADEVTRLTGENGVQRSRIAELEKRVCFVEAAADGLRKSLRAAEDKLDALGVVVLIVDGDGLVRFANRRACLVLGYGRDDILGRKFFDNYVPASIRAFAKSEAKRLLNGDASAEREYTGLVVDRNGAERLITWYHSV
ncbi:MAG: PAS domain-containing protein, partial [bacterium]